MGYFSMKIMSNNTTIECSYHEVFPYVYGHITVKVNGQEITSERVDLRREKLEDAIQDALDIAEQYKRDLEADGLESIEIRQPKQYAIAP